jgi:hypothetical protein
VDVKTDDTRSEGQKLDLLAELEGNAVEGGGSLVRWLLSTILHILDSPRTHSDQC